MGPMNGSFQFGSKGVRFADILDGLSNTIVVGEKHVPLGKFGVGWWDCSMYNGDYYVCSSRAAGPEYPLAKTMTELSWAFGSYHPDIVQFAFGDGHVRSINVNIDPHTLGLLANRNDGEPVPDY